MQRPEADIAPRTGGDEVRTVGEAGEQLSLADACLREQPEDLVQPLGESVRVAQVGKPVVAGEGHLDKAQISFRRDLACASGLARHASPRGIAPGPGATTAGASPHNGSPSGQHKRPTQCASPDVRREQK